ncbi:DinB family protein [Geothrix sp. SG200]|uniref:DinB family protein n=1 Tax=Geothrix sp. SG200 TaxID=2922865 RepID=UPI001FABC461|nr:DinB family protein [Geothrix sp. SG200]
MLQDLQAILAYWRNARSRTVRVLEALAPEDLEWAPATGAFTFGDLFRHLAGLERFMYAENVQGRPSTYPGHGAVLAAGLDGVRAYPDRCHAESLAIFGTLADTDLLAPCVNPAGASMATWKWLRAMVEHEAHHRGQLYLMASLRGRPVAPRFGLTEEQLAAASKAKS